MAINFPSSPTNGQTYTSGEVTYTYNSTKFRWELESIPTGVINLAPTTIQLQGGTGDQGTLSWNTDEQTVDLIQNGSTLQLGQEIQYHVRNNSGATITNGTPVMATGTIGASGRITVSPMASSTKSNVKYFLGIATYDIPTDTDGMITSFGKVRHLNTTGALAHGVETWNDGDILYLDTTNNGYLTKVEPTSGMNVPCAFVIDAETVGTLFVRVTSIDENILASEIAYDNTTSELTATNVQSAIDELETLIGTAGGGSDFTYVLQSSSTTATADSAYVVTTSSGAITITLPASPTSGTKVKIIDNEAQASTNNITVSNNGELIMGSTDPLTVDVDNANFILVFIGGTKGWVIG